MDSVTKCLIAFTALMQMVSPLDFKLDLLENIVKPSLVNAHYNEHCIIDNDRYIKDNNDPSGILNGYTNAPSGLLSRQKRYTYSDPDSNLVRQFERHLTAREGEESCSLQEIVDMLVKECDRLSHKALNESIKRYADHNYLVHYNHTEMVYRYYRQRYQDFTESLYHKLIYIVPHLVKKHMRTVMVNVTADFKIVNIACMNRFQELDDRVNTHFLSYGELFRSILVESYSDIERNFYAIYTDKPQITGGLCR